MSPPDRQPVSDPPPPAARLPAALRPDGRAPRSRAERLLMLGTLAAISLAVAIPALVVTGIFGQRPRAKVPPPAARAAPAPGGGLLFSLQHSLDWLLPGAPKSPPSVTPEPADGLRERAEQAANQLLPASQSLGPDPIFVPPIRPEHIAARLEKIRRQAAGFGGTSTDGLSNGNEKHLFVDLPAAATAAFRLAVTTNAPVETGSPAPAVTASPAPAVDLDHVEIIIRPTADDE